MGVIQRQGIKNSLVNYFATGLGFIATVFIYPFDLEAKGLIDFLMNLGVLFIPYAQLGVFAVYYKYFSKFADRIGSFQRWIVTRLLAQFSIFVLVYFLLLDSLTDFLSFAGIDKSGNFDVYSPYIPLVIFCVLLQG